MCGRGEKGQNPAMDVRVKRKPYRVSRVVRAAKAGVTLHARTVHLTPTTVPRDVSALEHVAAHPGTWQKQRDIDSCKLVTVLLRDDR